MDVGTIIKQLIKLRGFNQKEFAKNIGISETSLSLLVKGKTRPSADTMTRISEELRVPFPVISYLTLSEEEIPESKREAYRMLAPIIKHQLSKLFEVDMNILKEKI